MKFDLDAYRKKPVPLKLIGTVQHYPWGGYQFIPSLIHHPNDSRKPYAELWFGAHHAAPSKVFDRYGSIPLDQLISKAPVEILGTNVIERFGERLPFLLKILDAREMLSIQVHPNKQQAEAGFAGENQRGIPLDAPQRIYKDDNHKPEVQVALSDFWMLHGFRPLEEIKALLTLVPECHSLLLALSSLGIEGLYRKIMTAPQAEIGSLLKPLIERLNRINPQDKDNPEYWVLKATQIFPDSHVDRGIFSIYLMNLLSLHPGDSTFQGAGVPHAYLQGATVELMANSDNVLRGGLTKKFIQVDPLLETIKYEGQKPEITGGKKQKNGITVFPTPVEDFELSRLDLRKGKTYSAAAIPSPQITFILHGGITIYSKKPSLDITRGMAFFAPANVEYKVEATENTVLYNARVP